MLIAALLITIAGVLLAASRQLVVPFAIAAAVAWVWVELSGPSTPTVANYSKPRNDRIKTYVLQAATTVGCEKLSALKGLLADAAAQAPRTQAEQESYLMAANCRLIRNSPSLWWDLHGVEENGKFLKLSSLGDGPTLIYQATDFVPR